VVTISAKQQATDFLCPINVLYILKVGRIDTENNISVETYVILTIENGAVTE
jgi:hypothetical protein